MTGNHCKNFRQKWDRIMITLQRKYYTEIEPVMEEYNALVNIDSQPNQHITSGEVLRAKQLLRR